MKYASCYERYVDLTTEHVAAMRDWCLDCDCDEESVVDAADCEIVRWVAKQYDGGVRQFILDCA